MAGVSILYELPSDRVVSDTASTRETFRDLHLDAIIASIIARRERYELHEFFAVPLRRVGAIIYRQEALRDFENPELLGKLNRFAEAMRSVHHHLTVSDKLYYQNQKDAWRLEAAALYCDAVTALSVDLSSSTLGSRALRSVRDYVCAYAGSPAFLALATETKDMKAQLRSVRYCVLIKAGAFEVKRYEEENDYAAEVEKTFAIFKQDAVTSYLATFPVDEDFNHVEAKILEFVAKLHPQAFASLEAYAAKRHGFVDEGIALFDREAHFYIAWLEHVAKFAPMGLRFCYPELSRDDKPIRSRRSFDLALAEKLLREKRTLVCNDFELNGEERIIVVTGPNQGGKTTFARTFGQLHFLASIGCQVPGDDARLFLFDAMFTHFEREEKAESLRGKLQDDLLRIHAILERATPDSILVLNEIFTSTTLKDALFLSGKVMEVLRDRDMLAVWVTFLDELSSANAKTVSMMSTVAADNPDARSFKIVRKAADGLSYALSIAEKYQLTHQSLRERLSR